MNNLSIDTLNMGIFRVNAAETEGGSDTRATFVGYGRLLAYEHLRKGVNAIDKAMGKDNAAAELLDAKNYKAINEKFRNEHLLYAAKKCCEAIGTKAPETFEEFKKMSMNFYGNSTFYKVLQGIYQEIITPILPTVYSTAVSQFADVIEVGFGETAVVTVGSNDIPVFQDSAWGASMSVPSNRFYSKDITLNPQPKTAEIAMKWVQLVGNNVDFGVFFANLAAGMYAKTMGMWNQALQAAATNPTLIPAGLTQTFSSQNWVALANKLAALNGTTISNIFATGNAVALSKVLPTEVTGSTNVNMDAAIATLLGADYTRSGYLGQFMAVRLMPLMDAIIPGTQNSTVQTILSPNDIWMMAGNGRKPMTIAYNSYTPITIEIEPTKTNNFEMVFNMTIALDSAAVFASKVGHMTI